jgi:hypothetical protein
VLGVGEKRWKALRVSEKSDDINVIGCDEVEPSARKAGDAPESQALDAADLSQTRRAGTGHLGDRIECSDGRSEESLAELISAFMTVVAGALDEIELGERTKA